jgi:hypothetical protein
MSRWIFFLILVLLTSPLRAEQGRVVPSAPTVSSKVPVDDIELPVEVPVPLTEWLLHQGQESRWLRPTIAVALLGVMLLLIFLRRNKRFHEQNTLSPDASAQQALAQAEQLIKEDQCAAFTALFDQTVRRYLEACLGIAALQQTAGELIRHLEQEDNGLPETLQSYKETLENWLRNCEAGKFAGASLSHEEMIDMTTQLRNFIAAGKELAERNNHGQPSLR